MTVEEWTGAGESERGGGAGPFVGSDLRMNECGAEQQNSAAPLGRAAQQDGVGKQARNRNEATADKEWNLYLGAIGFRCPTKTTLQGKQGQGRLPGKRRSGMPCPACVLDSWGGGLTWACPGGCQEGPASRTRGCLTGGAIGCRPLGASLLAGGRWDGSLGGRALCTAALQWVLHHKLRVCPREAWMMRAGVGEEGVCSDWLTCWGQAHEQKRRTAEKKKKRWRPSSPRVGSLPFLNQGTRICRDPAPVGWRTQGTQKRSFCGGLGEIVVSSRCLVPFFRERGSADLPPTACTRPHHLRSWSPGPAPGCGVRSAQLGLLGSAWGCWNTRLPCNGGRGAAVGVGLVDGLCLFCCFGAAGSCVRKMEIGSGWWFGRGLLAIDPSPVCGGPT